MQDELRPGLIGARVQRLEDPRLLTGQGSFVDDLKLPGILHIAFCRSDIAHGRIGKIEIAAAAAMHGVVAVVRAEDIVDASRPLRATSRMADYYATDLPVLALDKVRYVGEPVVAVIADSRAEAEDAAERVEIDYLALPPLTDPEAAAETGAVRLHEEAAGNIIFTRQFVRGEVDEAMSGAALRVSGRFRMRRKTPGAIENRGYLANYMPGRRHLTLYSSTQVPGIIKDVLADILDLPGNRVRVVAGDVGGGFGGKASLYPEEVLVCILSRRFGRPVKWISDRLEDLISTSQAFDEIVDAELALDAEGNILALEADVIGDVGAYSIYPWTAALEPVQVVSFLPGPYRVSAYRGRVRGIATCKPPSGPYRGVGRPISTFVMERLIDMAARRLSIDPVILRRRNLVTVAELPYRAPSGLVWDKVDFEACLTAACDLFGLEKIRSEQAKARAQGRWYGIGIAAYAELTGIGSRISAAPGMPINTGIESAHLRIDSSGAVTACFGIASHGQGLETTLAQVVAEELGTRVEDIEVIQGDSAAVAHGTGTYASRSTVLAGGAAIISARALRKKVIEAASHLLETSVRDLDIIDGEIKVVGTDRKMSFRQLARAVYSEMGRLPKDVRETIELEARETYDPYFGTTTPACHAVALEIDPGTYTIKIHRYAVAGDCGRVINPLIVDGQVHGGVAQGIGAALLEEVVHDAEGQILTGSLVDYLLPSAVEVPAIEVRHIQTGTPDNVGGFRGLGEGGTIGAPAAIANAISDALAHLGIEIDELPVTPERLFRLCEKVNRNEKDATQ